jgi:hypothetical protein
MNKKLFGLMIGLAAMGAIASASVELPTCESNVSLQTYIDLGSGGCQLDDKVFSNFNYTGQGTPQAEQVTVNAVNTPLNPGFNFGAAWGVSGENQSADFQLSFTVDVLQGGFPIDDDSLGIDFGQIVGTGAVNVNESVCLGGNFLDGPGINCSTELASYLNVFHDGSSNQLFDHDIFLGGATYTHISVFKDIALSTGTGTDAKANFSSLSQRFSETAVPEPVTFSMMGLGLLGLGLMRRRQAGKK